MADEYLFPLTDDEKRNLEAALAQIIKEERCPFSPDIRR
jgi:hypothetical protein